MSKFEKRGYSMADGRKPTWEYIFPVIGLMFFIFGEHGILRDFWIALGGSWVSILLAWHHGWRKVNGGRP